MTNLLLVPGQVRISLALDPVYNGLTSLYLVALASSARGFDPWVEQTAAALSPEEMRLHRVLFDVLYSAFEPDEEWPSFPAFLDHLAKKDPLALRNRFLRHMFPQAGRRYAQQSQLVDLETFRTQIDRSEFDQEIDEALLAEAHTLLADPTRLRQTLVNHLEWLWLEALADEWARTRPLLEAVLEAYRGLPVVPQPAYEAIQVVTGRDVRNHWVQVLAPAEHLRFIPSPHVGPYLFNIAYGSLVRVVFGARPDQITGEVPVELSRADLLVQLHALADDTRLRILELLHEAGELCAQQIISQLKLTKSNASRHLSQLSAAGYVVEYQRSGKTKCYTLKPERFQEISTFLTQFGQGGRSAGSIHNLEDPGREAKSKI